MAATADALKAQLDALRRGYAAKLPEKIQAVADRLEALAVDATGIEDELRTLHRMVHSLAGSGATFGLPDITARARPLEHALKRLVEASDPLSAEQRSELLELLGALRTAAERSGAPAPAEPPIEKPDAPPRVAAADEQQRLLYLVEDDVELANDLALQLSHFGYDVRLFEKLAGLEDAVQRAMPAAVLMDIVFPEGQLAGADALIRLQRSRERPLPVLFMSARDDLPARLQAVRAGGSAYFTKPFDVGVLIDRLDELTQRVEHQPFRILIIDDEAAQAEYHATLLQGAGMRTHILTDPLQVMRALVEFQPDLILMDVYMPGCSGRELAVALRQQEAYVGIPIVFLSTESDIDKQLSAMSLGADDFVNKSVRPAHLVSIVASRAQRARVLRSLMQRDSLTGLLNHTYLVSQLGNEVSRARRREQPLAFAMIDLDHFKAVNDTYGHTTGDRVLKSLAHLLQQRLRRTDVIGRYGGEEFAVVLGEVGRDGAVQVLDKIRGDLSRVRFQAGSRHFSVTMSCGISTFPDQTEPARLIEAADRALYEAKNSGRNRIQIAS